MTRKFYGMDADFGYSMGGIRVLDETNEQSNVIVECECGTHMLKITSDKDILNCSDGSIKVRQSFYLAMFSYGDQKRGFWSRLKIAWNYMRTGEMFSDQLCLTPQEADKAATFIKNNVVITESN